MISHNFHVKVYYKDIDQMGIVYYSRYFEFFELARTELLKSIGFAVKDIEKNEAIKSGNVDEEAKKQFLKGAEIAYETILTSFSKGDKENLKTLFEIFYVFYYKLLLENLDLVHQEQCK